MAWRGQILLLLVILAAAAMEWTEAQVVRRGERPPPATAEVIAVEPRAGSALLRTRRERMRQKVAGYDEALAGSMVDFAGACLDVSLIDRLTVSPK